MIGRKEKKRWTEVAEFFGELEIEPELWELSEEPLRRFEAQGEALDEVAEEDASEDEESTEDALEEEVEAEEAAVEEEEQAEESVEVEQASQQELVAGVADAPIAELVSDTVSTLAAHLNGESIVELDRSLPASTFFQLVDWSGNGETKAEEAPVPTSVVKPSFLRPASRSASASNYFASLPWDGKTAFEPARLHSPRGLGRLMETATQQALRTAKARGSNVVPFPTTSTARAYFSQIQWQKAAN